MGAHETDRRVSGPRTGRGTARWAAVSVLLMGGALLVAGCTSAASAPPGDSGSSVAPSASVAPAGSPTSAPSGSVSPGASQSSGACRTADLAVKVVLEPGRHAAGSTYYPIVFTNKGAAPCVLSGYPGASLASADGGSDVGKPATPDGTPTTTVTLAPGADAHAVLQVSNADVFDAATCGPVDAPHWLRVTPPGETASLYVSFTIETKACSKGAQLAVSAISAGAGS